MSIFGGSADCHSSHRKPLITIWAETRGNLDVLEPEWSFGAAARGAPQLHNGYPMACSGRVIKMALSVVGSNGSSPHEAFVSMLVDGKSIANGRSNLWKPPNEQVAVLTLSPPIEVAAGSVINFASRKKCPAKVSIVSLLIEVDL